MNIDMQGQMIRTITTGPLPSAVVTMPDVGIRYVAESGDDSNDGLSWATAKRTIAAGVSCLPNSWPRKGGRVYVGNGIYPVTELVVTTQNVHISGVSAGGTVLVPQGNFGIKFHRADHCAISDVQFDNLKALKYSTFYGRALWVSSSKFCVLDNVWFHQLSQDYAGDSNLDVAPAAVYVDGTATFADWHKLRTLDVWGCYRGVVLANNGNLQISDSTFRACIAESFYALRRDIGNGGAGGTSAIIGCWFAGTSAGNAGYLVYLDTDPAYSDSYTGTKLVGCITEPMMNSGKNHIYTNMSNVIIDAHTFTGTGNGVAVFFDVLGNHCVVGVNRKTGSQGPDPIFVDNGQDNTWG